MAAPQPVLVLPETRPAEVLAARYAHIRRVSLEICEPLETEDFVVQSMPDASPTKWHLAHTSWFFEQFLLKQLLPGYRAFHADFEYLFNSYYQSVGRMHERPQRGPAHASDGQGSAAVSRARRRAHAEAPPCAVRG